MFVLIYEDRTGLDEKSTIFSDHYFCFLFNKIGPAVAKILRCKSVLSGRQGPTDFCWIIRKKN